MYWKGSMLMINLNIFFFKSGVKNIFFNFLKLEIEGFKILVLVLFKVVKFCKLDL